MKHLLLTIICLVAFSNYFNESKPIDKMNKKFYFFTVKGSNRMTFIYNEVYDKEQEIYLDTFYGYKQSNGMYLFNCCENVALEVKLKRCWHLLKPCWNTYLISDTIEYLPIDTIRLFCADTVINFSGFSSAFAGPLAEMKRESINTIFSIRLSDLCVNKKQSTNVTELHPNTIEY